MGRFCSTKKLLYELNRLDRLLDMYFEKDQYKNSSITESVLNRKWWRSGNAAIPKHELLPLTISPYFKREVLDRNPSFPLNTFKDGSFSLSNVENEDEMNMILSFVPQKAEGYPYRYKFKSAHRVQNEALWAVFKAKATDAGFYYGFHGPLSDENMESILTLGFAPQMCRTGAYGPGSYLAKDPVVSMRHFGVFDEETKTVSLILVACALGKICLRSSGSEDKMIPDGYGAFGIGGDRSGPEVVVVQDYRRIYPAYVVTYTFEDIDS